MAYKLRFSEVIGRYPVATTLFNVLYRERTTFELPHPPSESVQGNSDRSSPRHLTEAAKTVAGSDEAGN